MDGSLDSSSNKTLTTTVATYLLVVGRRSYPDGSPTWRFADGLIDAVRLCNRALSEDEVEAIYYAGD